MGKEKVDYKNGKIYKIVSDATDKIYVGSTTQPLHKRLAEHTYNFRHWKNGKRHYTTSCEVIGAGSYHIVLVEVYPCDTIEELRARERHYVDALECVNKHVPTRTQKEWYESNREAHSEKTKQYREANKEAIAKQKKQYFEANKERILERQKRYREDNREVIRDRAKQHYEQHKIENLKKHECPCGGRYSHRHKRLHERTSKHQQYLQSTQVNIVNNEPVSEAQPLTQLARKNR